MQWASVLAVQGLSNRGSRALEHWLRGCGAGGLVALGMGELPKTGIEPLIPVWAGRFSTTRNLNWQIIIPIVSELPILFSGTR